MKQAAVPSLDVRRQPGLSQTLTGPKTPKHCQSCGDSSEVGQLVGWLECDEWDKLTAQSPVVILCERCSKRLIDAHARLYHRLPTNKPFPGAMDLCVMCRFRDGVACRHPAAKANGGPGVGIKVARPMTGFVCCSPRSYSGMFENWPSPATGCAQRETLALGKDAPPREALAGNRSTPTTTEHVEET